jgi:hypothetical protein
VPRGATGVTGPVHPTWRAVTRVTVSTAPTRWAAYPRTDCGTGMTREALAQVMAGDLQRIALYPARGFQCPHPMPLQVWDALRTLAAQGYGGHMMRAPASAGAGAAVLASPEQAYEGFQPGAPAYPECCTAT